MFHPPAIDRAINAQMDTICVLDRVTSRPHLDTELRDQLLLAKSALVLANRALSGLR